MILTDELGLLCGHSEHRGQSHLLTLFLTITKKISVHQASGVTLRSITIYKSDPASLETF